VVEAYKPFYYFAAERSVPSPLIPTGRVVRLEGRR